MTYSMPRLLEIPNDLTLGHFLARATAASESCSGIRHRLMSRCERSFVGRGASIGYDCQTSFRRAIAPGRGPIVEAERQLGAPSLSTGFVARTTSGHGVLGRARSRRYLPTATGLLTCNFDWLSSLASSCPSLS